MSMIYIVRHGETDWNTEHRMQGQSTPDMPLNENGLAQAHAIATSLSVKPDKIYTSVLLRAVQTGKIIADTLGVPHETNAALNEMSFGDYEGFISSDFKKLMLADGMTGEELRTRHKSIDPQYDDQRHPGGESKREVRTRIDPAMQAIATNTNIAMVVMHNAAFRVFLSPYDAAQSQETLDHHHVMRLEYDADHKTFKVLDRIALNPPTL